MKETCLGAERDVLGSSRSPWPARRPRQPSVPRALMSLAWSMITRDSETYGKHIIVRKESAEDVDSESEDAEEVEEEEDHWM